MAFITEFQEIIRPLVFFILLIAFLLAENFYPLAKRKCNRLMQWSTNISLAIINTISLHIVLPLLAVGVAQLASQHQIGLFNIIEFPELMVTLISLILLDFIIYWQHRLFHNIPILWRLHRLHHTEIGLDTTSAVRFHPIEIILSMLIKMFFVLLLGIPVVAVIIFEILLNGLALFNHSNVQLPTSIDRCLRKLIVTPNVHWIHHSPKLKETNSNYGFNLIIWDKIFNSYVAKPMQDYRDMQQGLSDFGLTKSLNLKQLLLIPFIKKRK